MIFKVQGLVLNSGVRQTCLISTAQTQNSYTKGLLMLTNVKCKFLQEKNMKTKLTGKNVCDQNNNKGVICYMMGFLVFTRKRLHNRNQSLQMFGRHKDKNSNLCEIL